MRSGQQRWVRRLRLAAIIAVLWCASPSLARGQAADQSADQSSFAGDVIKRVVFDPTTYAPAALGYVATMRDWNSSQPFFNNGWLERNPQFTVSGLPNDRPVSYAQGRNQILRDAFANMQMSLVNNATNAVIERVLIAQHPDHRRLWRSLGWVERIAFSSYLSYQLSADHFRQAAENERQARTMGLR